LIDNAVTNSIIFVPEHGKVSDIRVGLRVNHERASDLVFHLTSPDGTRILLMENRGRTNALGIGGGVALTNVYPTASSGTFQAQTNVLTNTLSSGLLVVDYQFYNAPDRMTVYLVNQRIFDSGMISGAGRFVIRFGPGAATNIVIIMNEAGYSVTNTVWDYTATVISDYIYTTFTENTNLTITPIKFGEPPYTNSPSPLAAVVLDDGFDYGVNGSAPSGFSGCCVSGWDVAKGDVDVIYNGSTLTYPADSPPFALDLGGDGAGTIVTNVFLQRGAAYTFSFAFSKIAGNPAYFPQAEIELTGITNFIVTGVNDTGWDHTNIDFVATSAATSVRMRSLTGGSGVFVDSVKIQKKPGTVSLSDAYFLPEESLQPFVGTSAFGRWTLEVWDSRLGGAVTNVPLLLGWKLEIAYPQTNPPVILLTNGSMVTNIVAGSNVIYYAVEVPCGFGFANNTLTCLTNPSSGLNLIFDQYVLPTNGPNDVLLLSGVTATSNAVLTIGQPPLVSATRYYLAVANVNPGETTPFSLAINFVCLSPPFNLSNNVCLMDQLAAGASKGYQYQFSPDAVAGFFALTSATGNTDLYVRHSTPPTLFHYDYAAITPSGNELITVGTNSLPVPISSGNPNRIWFLVVTNNESVPVSYCVNVTEVFETNLFPLTVNSPEPGRTVVNVDYYVVNIDPSTCSSTFRVYDQLGNLNFYIAYDRLPSAVDNDGSAFAPGGTPGPPVDISVSPALIGDWFIAVVNTNPAPVTYSILVAGSMCFAAPPVIKSESFSYSTNGFRLEWDAAASDHYQVQYTETFAPTSWQTVTNVINSADGHFKFLDVGARTNLQRFYRILRVP
jgi:hypothetical protein